MPRTSIEIRTSLCPGSVFRPASAGTWPAILMYMDGPGIRPALFDMGERLASHGYLVLLPDFFYRMGPYALLAAKGGPLGEAHARHVPFFYGVVGRDVDLPVVAGDLDDGASSHHPLETIEESRL
jgi:dienelactone hydrolase